MKRLISLLLALFITIGINPVFNNVFATNTVDFEDVEVKDAFAILSLINVFPDSEAGESAFTKPVSRIEFATYATENLQHMLQHLWVLMFMIPQM